MKNIIKICQRNLFLIWIIVIGLCLRFFYLFTKTGDLFVANLGGDSCYHYNVAYNIANGLGPKTSFIFSYWFLHPEIPAFTDLYGPGYAMFLSLFLYLGDNFFNLRIANFLIGILSIFITYLIGKKIHSKKLGLISAFLISINFFHIENSTVVMREIFNLFLTQLFFLNLFYINKQKLLIFLIGLITGYISISTGIWPLYIFIFFIYCILNLKKISINFIFIFLTGFLFTSLNWIIITKKYFGKFYYSNLNFYPYVDSWSDMMLNRGLPNVENFWNSIDLKVYLSNHFFWFIKNLYKASLVLSPTFIYFLFFLLIPFILYGAYKLKNNGKILIFFSILYFLGLSFASYALGGNLWPRHFLPLLFSVSILLGSGFIPVLDFIQKKYKNYNYDKFIYALFVFSFLITIAGIKVKDSYWQRNTHQFYKFGDKIKKITNERDVIMYSVAVPDLWCSTRRHVVHDIARGGSKSKLRVKKEIQNYNVSYIFIDISEDNFEFSNEKLEKTLLNYQNLNLKLILSDKKNGYFFYRIVQN